MEDNAPFITADLDEFCNIHAMEYAQTDTLRDISGNVVWQTASGKLRGVLEEHDTGQVSHWGYIHLK